MSSTSPAVRFTLGKHQKVLTSAEFNCVFAEARKRDERWFTVFLKERESSDLPSRLGLVVSRKVGNAVVRNRVKRLLREAFRLSQHSLPAGLDVVILPRGEQVRQFTLQGLIAALRRVVRRPLPTSRPQKR